MTIAFFSSPRLGFRSCFFFLNHFGIIKWSPRPCWSLSFAPPKIQKKPSRQILLTFTRLKVNQPKCCLFLQWFGHRIEHLFLFRCLFLAISDYKDSICLQLLGQVSRQPKIYGFAKLDPKDQAFGFISCSLFFWVPINKN